MSTVTPYLNLVKPAPLENFSRVTYNNNLDLIDQGFLKSPNVIGVPAGKKPIILPIFRSVTTGAGGEDKTVANATDANGFGGLWFADVGVTFENIISVDLTGFHPLDGYMYSMGIVDFNTTRIKFKAWRWSPAGPANGYGSLTVNGTIIGY